MYKTVNEILEYAYKNRRVAKGSKLSFDNEYDAIEQNKNIDLLIDINFLKPLGGDRYEITYAGRVAFESKELDKIISKKIRDKIIDGKKNRYDYLFSKYRYWTYWIVFTIGSFGGIYSIYDVFIKSQSTKERIQQIEKDILENKESVEEVHTLILDQKKDTL